MITPLQKKAFFKLFTRACDVQSIPAHQKEDYRHSLIEKAVPTSRGSLKAIKSGAEFDSLMLALAHEAQDFDAAQKYVVAEGNRLAKMTEALVWQIWQIENGLTREKNHSTALTAPEYISGILRQAHFPSSPYLTAEGWWLDCTIPHLQKLIQMLDTHRRRLLRQWDAKLEWSPKLNAYVKMRAAFDIHAHYQWTADHTILYKRTGLPTKHPLIHIQVCADA